MPETIHVAKTMHTFDVFDTIITRKTATPLGIFALVQYELLRNSQYNDIPMRYRENFFYLRRSAEKMAHFIYEGATTIDNIYEALGSNNDISINQLMQIKKLELDTEYLNSIPIDENIEKVRQLRHNGEKVVFISDMYLSSEQIRLLICKHAQDFKDIPLYVSCEYGCNKFSGDLFAKVKEQENAEFEDWKHIGDNLQADIKGAMQNGIAAFKYDYPEFHLFEGKLIRYYTDNAFLQITIGAARNARMKKGIVGKELNNEFVYGCSYSAPMIYFYVSWVLKQSVNKGIKRLYFVSRDGYIPKIIADYLIEKYELDIQTKYIYGSRKAWFPAAFNKDKDLAYCSTLQSIANYFDVAIDDIKTYIPDIDSDMLLTSEQLEKINKNINFKEYLAEMQKDKSVITRRYLLQELELSDDSFAFVDINGRGFSLANAVLLLKPYYQGKFRSFWCNCTTKPNMEIQMEVNMEMYIYICNGHVSDYLENLCRASHGITIGYEEKCGKIVPIFGELDYENFDIESYIDGIESFTEEYSNFYGMNDNLDIFAKYLNIIFDNENYEILDFHSKFVHNKIELGGYRFTEIFFVQNAIVKAETKYQGSRIAVYGAGIWGKELRCKLGKRCVLWFDSAYEDYISQGYNVRNPYEASENNSEGFDIMIIAIENKKIADEVKEFLISIKVPSKKIFWIKNI